LDSDRNRSDPITEIILLGTISPIAKLDYLLLDFSMSSKQFDNVLQKNKRDWELKCGIEILPK